MANHEAIQVSSFPMPPQQYKLFTDENVLAGRTSKPPLPPADTYTMFGNSFSNDDNIIRPLESQGFKRLYPQHFDRKKELKKFNHSLLVNFLDLMDLLVSSPDSPKRTEKIEDLSLLFVNMHHLVNEFRPHQARETLRVMMEMQKRQRLETIQRFQKHLDKVNSIVNMAFSSLPDKDDNSMLFLPKISEPKKAKGNDLEQLDHIMCDIVDNQGI